MVQLRLDFCCTVVLCVLFCIQLSDNLKYLQQKRATKLSSTSGGHKLSIIKNAAVMFSSRSSLALLFVVS